MTEITQEIAKSLCQVFEKEVLVDFIVGDVKHGAARESVDIDYCAYQRPFRHIAKSI